MIIKFNLNLFTHEDADIQDTISKIMLHAIDDVFLWDEENLDNIFLIEDEIKDFFEPFSEEFLSRADKKKIIETVGNIYKLIEYKQYIKPEHKKYLTTICVGFGEQEEHPDNVLRIMQNPSKIILENATNDWKFIESIATNYCNHASDRKPIYKLVKKAIDEQWLESEQAGGKTQIKVRIEDLSTNRYSNIARYKLMTLFDSDRQNPNILRSEQRILINYLKDTEIDSNTNAQDIFYEDSDKIVWHMLYKNELENYVPLAIVFGSNELNLSQQQKDEVNNAAGRQDFVKYSRLPTWEGVNTKTIFPNLFENCTREQFEELCQHHQVDVELPGNNRTLVQISEIEQILLKIAKII